MESSTSSEISSAVGGLSNFCSKIAYALLILFMDPILLSGSLTILDCSANACKIDCLIHQTAYDINLNPLVSSNLFAALISPRLPSLIRSGRVSP